MCYGVEAIWPSSPHLKQYHGLGLSVCLQFTGVVDTALCSLDRFSVTEAFRSTACNADFFEASGLEVSFGS